MTSTPEIRELAAQPAVVERTETDAAGLAAAIDRGFPKLLGRLQELEIEPAGPPFTRYLQTGERLEVQLGVPVASGADRLKDEEISSLPAGRAAVLRYFGPYDGLAVACEGLGAWIGEQGEQARGPFWEAYVTDPREEPDPQRRLTEIYVPIA